MAEEINASLFFCKEQIKFLEGLINQFKTFSVNKERYVLSDRFVTEFLESYERHNLSDYKNNTQSLEKILD